MDRRLLAGYLFCLLPVCAQQAAPLTGTVPWSFPADIVLEQHNELLRYFETRIYDAARQRGRFWQGADWPRIAGRNRAELRRMIGAVDQFLTPAPERKQIAENTVFTFSLVEWPVLRLGNSPATPGPSGAIAKEYGILLESKRQGKHPAVIAIPDADLSAADITGLSQRLPQSEQYARSLAADGYIVFVPFFTQRRTFSQPWTEDRDWLVRLGYQVGRHLIGSEVQQVSSAIDFLCTLPGVDSQRIGVVGSGQGGLTALYAAALDTRLKAALVAHYFDRRERAYDEPEDRILWKHLERFGDAEMAAMIAPRALVVDRGGPEVESEVQRARVYFERAGASDALRLIDKSEQQRGLSKTAIEEIDAILHPAVQRLIPTPPAPQDPEIFFAIANAQFSQWQARYRNLAMEAYAYRDSRWHPDTSSLANYERWSNRKREVFLDTIGHYPAPSGPFKAQSMQLYDEPAYRGYRLSVRLYDGVHAYGILLVPKDIKPGERRPVVFTQHGFGGTPEDAVGVNEDSRAAALYAKFGSVLAGRGYIVFAPLISAQTAVNRNALVRRAQLVGLTVVGIEIRKIARMLDFLETLPFVDKNRFAFYGLSYGGFTALWLGPVEPRFQVVISSGHFNDWNLKTTDLTEGTSFLFHKDTFDMFNFDLLHSFNHSDLASMVPPRAFMVEIGSRDGVVIEPRRFVDVELARVTDLYRQLGIPEKGRIARFDGPHRIDGSQAYAFLDEMLGWTPRH